MQPNDEAQKDARDETDYIAALQDMRSIRDEATSPWQRTEAEREIIAIEEELRLIRARMRARATDSRSERDDALAEAVEELEEIAGAIDDAVKNARSILCTLDEDYGTRLLGSADAYWIAHVRTALGTYGTPHATTLDDTIDSIRRELGDDDV